MTEPTTPTTCITCGGALPPASHFCPKCGEAQGAIERPRLRQTKSLGEGWTEFLDKAWDFFASVKVAWVLIILIAVASIAGTLIEQESLYNDWRPPELYYPARYGETLGPLFMKLGLTHAYSSLWYVTLIVLLVINLIICSFHRLVPLHRMLVKPQVWKLPHFIRRQEVVIEQAGTLEQVEAKLKQRRFKVLRDRENLYADRGRISRYGPYIIHIGLIICAFAAFAKAIPGWDETRDVWIQNGQTVKVPDTNFALTNQKFTVEFYENGAPKRYATDTVVSENGETKLTQTIEVNHPLAWAGWEIYQSSWREEPGTAHVQVVSAIDQKVITTVALDLRQPEASYPLPGGYTLAVRDYLHDFQLDPETQQPVNGSYEVKNPAFRVEFLDPNGKVIGAAAHLVFSKEDPIYNGPLYLKTEKVDTKYFTGLKLHRDRTVLFMFGGLAVVLGGLAITFFLFHFQVWVREEGGVVLIGGRAYKNKYGLKQELHRLFAVANPEDEGSLDDDE
ncbi:MAG TPA: cytochrome c biogenesis protein ResB [Symbiobacteriaceae bacterium]|nr:cytochrome c biogenesis protein ResB [Symbiobacteriaceae bacterium]